MSFIPTFTRQQVVDKDGYFTSSMHQFFDVLTVQLQNNISNDGLVVPSLGTTAISNVTAPTNDNAKGPGTLFYDHDTHDLKVNINGTVKTVMTS